tara:strand:+ start:1734 stop:2036 length:303 start_codon:yes stop_codon:yes gene_type:complete
MNRQDKREHIRNLQLIFENFDFNPDNEEIKTHLDIIKNRINLVVTYDGNYIFDDIVSIDFCLDLIKETIKSESIRITRETFKVLNDLILISDKLVKELKS